jgi:uncharacterized protein (TIGR00645 family)
MERVVARLLLSSRWILSVFYFGLIGILALLAAKFLQKLYEFAKNFLDIEIYDLIIYALKLIDIAFMGNLIVIVILAGYENFVSSFDQAEGLARPAWIRDIGFGDLKTKLITSIVAISTIQLLEAFINIEHTSKEDILWMVVIQVVFLCSGLLLSYMDILSHRTKTDS